MIFVWAVAGSVGISACADNAVLDLSIVVPPRTTAANTAVLDVRPASGFDLEGSDWPSSAAFPELSVELGATPLRIEASVPAEHVDQDLLVRVRFCATAGCATGSPAVCYRLARPFHGGRLSVFHTELVAIPEAAPVGLCSWPPIEIDRCSIGCAEGRPWGPGASFCDDEGLHTCDQ